MPVTWYTVYQADGRRSASSDDFSRVQQHTLACRQPSLSKRAPVDQTLPYGFHGAYEPDRMTLDWFQDFGATRTTLASSLVPTPNLTPTCVTFPIP